jgi:hypothetical protein
LVGRVSLSLSTYTERIHQSRCDSVALDDEVLMDFTSGCMDYVGGIVYSILLEQGGDILAVGRYRLAAWIARIIIFIELLRFTR